MGKQGPCNHCGVTSTPLWRNGPPEKPVLCNACGSRWRTKGTLSNYTPLHSRLEHDELDGECLSNVRNMSIKKRKLTQQENFKVGKFVIKLNRVHQDVGEGEGDGDSCSAISSTDLTCPIQWEERNRTKRASIEKLTKDLYTILNEQRQSSHLFDSYDKDLIFETGSLPVGYGSFLIGHPSSFETSSFSIKKVNEESFGDQENLGMCDSSSQIVEDEISDYDLLLALPEAEVFI